MKITLASNSPRRKELLGALELDFEVRTLDGIDETYPQGLTMTGIPEHISRHKAMAYALAEDELLLFILLRMIMPLLFPYSELMADGYSSMVASGYFSIRLRIKV